VRTARRFGRRPPVRTVLDEPLEFLVAEEFELAGIGSSMGGITPSRAQVLIRFDAESSSAWSWLFMTSDSSGYHLS
jgi:hypothetical protein